MSEPINANALPANHRLEEYTLERTLGTGGFGITYLARDTRLGSQVAIKEYFPQAFATRDQTNTILANATDASDVENYHWGLQEFLKEARALAQFKHANIVRVLRYLEAHGTAYMVMEYEEGENLSHYLAGHGGYLNEQTLLSIFLPVLNGLQAVHDAGLLHLDIKPDNIYLRRSGQPMLIDFGAARQRQGEKRSDKVALTPGYAALEQYPGHGDLGTWSDVYSLGATLYRCVVGRDPVDALERRQGLKKLHVDPLIPAVRFDRPHYSAHIRQCVDMALTLKAANRPHGAVALQNGLMGKDLTAPRHKVEANAYSRGTGFIGDIGAAPEAAPRRRYISRSALEKLLVAMLFIAVMVIVPLHVLVAAGQIEQSTVFDEIDRLMGVSVERGKRATRYVEEKVFGISRPPEYVPSPSLQTAARPTPTPPAVVSLPPFDVTRTLVASVAVPAPVLALAYLQQGKQLVTALDNGAVELRNANSGALIRQFSPATGERGAVAASADGRLLAFSAAENTIQIWDMSQATFLVELPGHRDAIVALAFSPDGKWLASASRDQSATLWDLEDGKAASDLSRPKSEALALAFSPDGARLAVADSSGGIRYLDMATRRDIAYVPTRDQPIAAIAFSPDGKWFAVGGEAGYLSLWDVSGKRADRALEAAPKSIHGLIFSPDSQWLIVAGSDVAVQLWNVAEARLDQRYEGGNRQTYALALAPGGSHIAAAGNDSKLTLWR